MTTVLKIPEVVGVFHDVDALYAAIDELQMSGFGRSEISMLAGETAVPISWAGITPITCATRSTMADFCSGSGPRPRSISSARPRS